MSRGVCIVVAALTIGAIAGSCSRAELLLYEPFLIGGSPSSGEYTVGVLDPTDAANDGQNPASTPLASFWSGGWSRASAANGQGTVQAAGLSYLGTSALGGSQIANFESRQTRAMAAPWTNATNGVFYISFLANFGRAGGVTGEDLGYRTVEFVNANNGFQFGIGYTTYGTNYTPLTGKLEFDLAALGGRLPIAGAPEFFAEDGATHLFVLRFNLSSATNADAVSLYLDPIQVAEPDIPAVSAANLNLTVGGIRGMTHFGAFASQAFGVFDELRIGTTYADVLPELPTPGDTDGDHDVDLVDYNNIVSNMNQIQVGAIPLLGDVARGDGRQGSDGRVTIADYRIWRDHYPTSPGTGSGGLSAPTHEVPEPRVWALLTFAAATISAARARSARKESER